MSLFTKLFDPPADSQCFDAPAMLSILFGEDLDIEAGAFALYRTRILALDHLDRCSDCSSRFQTLAELRANRGAALEALAELERRGAQVSQ